jgi:N-acetylglucosaminyldiphosphoundecaprenol N-acetyl-beta-D-mannosaminyltransferase
MRLSALDGAFQEIINASSMVVADGMPLVWASRRTGAPLPERIAGVDLVSECARLGARHGYRVFLLGAATGVAGAAADVLRRQYPGLNIVGTYSPSALTDEADRETVAVIRAARPDILLVAFGAPKQEKWISKHMDTLQVPVLIGVGGSFDMLSGRISRAPTWMQQTGLEWFYRFMREPSRLWKRYFLKDLPLFLRLILAAGGGQIEARPPEPQWGDGITSVERVAVPGAAGPA